MRVQSRGARSLNLCGFTCGCAARYPRAAPGPAPGSARRKGRAGTESFSQFSVPTIQAGRCHPPHSKPGDWEGEGEGERGVVLRQSDRSAPPLVFGPPTPGSPADRGAPGWDDAVRRGGGEGCLGPGRCCRTPPTRRELPAGSKAAGGATRAPRTGPRSPGPASVSSPAPRRNPPPRTSRARVQLAPLAPARLLRGRAPGG